MKIKNSGVYSSVDISVKDIKDDAFEKVMKNNGISYKKKNAQKTF